MTAYKLQVAADEGFEYEPRVGERSPSTGSIRGTTGTSSRAGRVAGIVRRAVAMVTGASSEVRRLCGEWES